MCEFETPSFVYYSYIAIVILSLITGFLIFFKDRKHSMNRNAFYFILVIVLWMLGDLAQWTIHTVKINIFFARISVMGDLIFLFFLYFSHSFAGIKLNMKRKILFSLPYIVLAFLAFTKYNIKTFDTSSCDYAHTLFISIYFYIFEIFYATWSSVILIKLYKNPIIPYQTKSQAKLLIFSICLLAIWEIIYEEISRISLINGQFIDNTPHFVVGNLFFISLIAFAIIKENLFEFKNVLLDWFTIFLWSIIFIGFFVFSTSPAVIIMCAVAYIALMIIFLKM